MIIKSYSNFCLFLFLATLFFQFNIPLQADNIQDDAVTTEEFKCNSKLSSTEVEKISKQVEAKYKQIKSLTANFTQSAQIVGLTDVIKSSGIATFKMPGKMNWEYQTPDNKKFISDGETVWFFEPQVNQVTVGQLKKTFDTEVPAMFMLGIGKISETFNLISGCETNFGKLLVMSPKNQTSSLKTLSLLVSKIDHIPIGARMADVSDTINEFVFKELVLDKELADSIFKFNPPSDADIIYNN